MSLTSCAIRGPQSDDEDADVVIGGEYPPIDPTQKYFKPGPPLATGDAAELAKRLAYHQQVIDGWQSSDG